MKVNRIYYWGCLIIAMTLSLVFLYNAALVLSNDDLFLNGVVKKVNPNSSVVTVDIKSLGCKGEMEIKADKEDISVLQESIDKEISFFIDSSTCNKNKAYNIKHLKVKVSKGR